MYLEKNYLSESIVNNAKCKYGCNAQQQTMAFEKLNFDDEAYR